METRAQRAERIDEALDRPMLLAAFLVIPVVVIEESDAAPWVRGLGEALNWAIWLAFLAELVVMLRVVPDRWRWLRTHPLEVLVVVLTPPFLPAGLASLRLLRLVRLLRLARLIKAMSDVDALSGARYAALVALTTVLTGGIAFAAVEPGRTAWDGIWWATVTMTTVGYGDISPETDAGRIVAMVVMVFGIGVFATLVTTTLRTVAARVAGGIEQEEDAVLAELRSISARLEALERRLDR